MEHEPQEDDPKSIFNGTGNTRYATSPRQASKRTKTRRNRRPSNARTKRDTRPTSKRVLQLTYWRVTTKRLTPIPLQAIANDEVGIARDHIDHGRGRASAELGAREKNWRVRLTVT
jgi:hypothetical protein